MGKEFEEEQKKIKLKSYVLHFEEKQSSPTIGTNLSAWNNNDSKSLLSGFCVPGTVLNTFTYMSFKILTNIF